MSHLNVASTAEMLAERLGVPHLVMAIPWDATLAESAIRSAAWSLSAGGLLAIHVPEEHRDRAAPLAAASREDLADLPLEDVTTVDAADGVAVLLLLNPGQVERGAGPTAGSLVLAARRGVAVWQDAAPHRRATAGRPGDVLGATAVAASLDPSADQAGEAEAGRGILRDSSPGRHRLQPRWDALTRAGPGLLR